MSTHWILSGLTGLWVMTFNVYADETLPVLRVGSEIYSNVSITSVTATDIYFKHAKGMGTAKLKNLPSDLQQHFHFNAAIAGEVARQQREGNAQFRQELIARQQTALAHPPKKASAVISDQEDLVVPSISAKSFRGKTPPQLLVEQWLNPPPDWKGKFVLVDFWATWCGPCRQSIPHLNALAAKYQDQLIVIGITDEPAAAVQKMTSPKIDYSVAVDTQARMERAVGVTGIPHALLIDPRGIVRFEGMPGYLNESVMAHLLGKYAE